MMEMENDGNRTDEVVEQILRHRPAFLALSD